MHHSWKRLQRQAHSRIDTALRPHTSDTYLSKFKTFLAPLSHTSTLLSFFERLAQNGSKAHTLSSNLSAISHYFKMYYIPTSALTHRKVLLLIKAVSINSHYTPSCKTVFTISTLTKLVQACDSHTHGPVYKAAFLLAYFVFLRLSNIAPSSTPLSDPSRHLLHSDIIFGQP